MALDRQQYGTVYEVNAFYMKRPGPPGSRVISKYRAFQELLKWLGVRDPRY
jgi:myo-inositol-1-phosphate synthase